MSLGDGWGSKKRERMERILYESIQVTADVFKTLGKQRAQLMQRPLLATDGVKQIRFKVMPMAEIDKPAVMGSFDLLTD